MGHAFTWRHFRAPQMGWYMEFARQTVGGLAGRCAMTLMKDIVRNARVFDSSVRVESRSCNLAAL